MNPLKAFESRMINVNIIRDNQLVSTIKGLKNTTKNGDRKMFNFFPDVDVTVGDIIEIPNTSFRYHVIEVEPKTWNGQISGLDAFYITAEEYVEKNKQPEKQTVYNIGQASNSIIGNQQNATINNGIDINEFRRLIETNGGTDKESLNKMADMLQTIIDNNMPVSKGTLSKFSDLIAKHSWVFTCATQILIKWLIK